MERPVPAPHEPPRPLICQQSLWEVQLIPPDRAHSGRFQMSGEPKLVHAAPLYYAGEYLPRNPLRTRVQSQPSSRNENGPEPLGAILISGGGGGNRTHVLGSRGRGVYECISGFWARGSKLP